MNHIHKLQQNQTEFVRICGEALDILHEKRVFLHGPKFTGVDLDGGRKDWIATNDVLAMLEELRSTLMQSTEVV